MKPGAYVGGSVKQFIQKFPFIFLVCAMLILVSVLKITVYYYNYSLLFSGSDHSQFKIAAWSLVYDFITILFINFPFLLLLTATRKIPGKLTHLLIRIIFCMINSFALLLNAIDIFYFRFHFQRSNIDLVYVLDHPIWKLAYLNYVQLATGIAFLSIIVITTWKLQNLFYDSFLKKNNYRIILVVLAGFLLASAGTKFHLTRKLVPTYPLVDLNASELNAAQNSMHTFVYSLYRSNHSLVNKEYFPDAYCDSVLPIKKVFEPVTDAPKNVVLFIMESIPEDFFDSAGVYKVRMPFFDSILHHSTYFSNAYSFGRVSVQGITSILSGTPTLTDIPLYHSSFFNLPKTRVGTALKGQGYQSLFFIGDTYDNFGFAKCVYWLGIDKYYCESDIPGSKTIPKGPIGIYDQYVLNFMQQKINVTDQPFLAINYNTTTHYPNQLPETFRIKSPPGYSRAMKSMEYYDSCLHSFFNSSQKEKWFKNTVFIFCADHWMSPDGFAHPSNSLREFRIPIIIYDPSINKEINNTSPVSQFDILGTILSLSGDSSSSFSFGDNLLDKNTDTKDNAVYNRLSNTLYQVVDSSYVLGFNIVNDNIEYLYNYKEDKNLQKNLKDEFALSGIRNALSDKIKIFYQRAVNHYFENPLK